MKKLFFALLLLPFIMTACSDNDDDTPKQPEDPASKTIHIAKAGTLKSLLLADRDTLTLEHLTVTGELIQQDIYDIRDNFVNLKTIDLKDVNIIESTLETPPTHTKVSANKLFDQSFRGMKKLETVILPKSLEDLGYEAFFRCDSLKEIDIPQQITVFQEAAFGHCENLERITFNKSATIGIGAFYACTKLSNINGLKNTLHLASAETEHSVMIYAFNDCDSIKNFIYEYTGSPEKAYKYEAFYNYNKSITNITFKDNGNKNPESKLVLHLEHLYSEVLEKIHLDTRIVPYISTDNDTNKILQNCTLYIPKGMREKYENSGDWRRILHLFKDIVEF